MLSVDQQLDLYTSVSPPDWLESLSGYREDPIAFLNEYRGNWSFSRDQLEDYLKRNPRLIDAYFNHCRSLRGIHDKILMFEEEGGICVFWSDHGNRRYERHFSDRVEAAIQWLQLSESQ